MAEKTLRGINFPGLDGTYFVPEVDSTLTKEGASADAKAVGVALSGKQPSGKYVKTINGAEPDDYGNVNIDVGSGESESGTKTQSDWNVADSNNPAYINNKPFSDSECLIPETTLHYTNDGSVWTPSVLVEDYLDAVPVAGNTYKVVWEGVEYACECVEVQGALCFGNVGLLTATGNNGMPFVLGLDVNGQMYGTPGWIFMSMELEDNVDDLTLSGVYTVRIESNDIKHLDNKFLSFIDHTATEIIPEGNYEMSYSQDGWRIKAFQTVSAETFEKLTKLYEDNKPIVVVIDGVEYNVPIEPTTDVPYENFICGDLKYNNYPFWGVIGVNVDGASDGGYASNLSIQGTEEDPTVRNIHMYADKRPVFKAEFIPEDVRRRPNADWNSNNSESESYIKNRPFYDDPLVTILAERDYELTPFDDLGYNFTLFNDVSVPIVAGETYDVLFNGTVYTRTAYINKDGVIILGNNAISNKTDTAIDTGDVFEIAATINGAWIATSLDAGTYTVRITQGTGEFKPLDAKFIPDSIATKDFVMDAIAGNTQETDIFPKQDVGGFALNSQFGVYGTFIGGGFDNLPFTLIAEETYMVEWDGNVYECRAAEGEFTGMGFVGIGDMSILGLSGNGEPFAIGYIESIPQLVFMSKDELETHNIRVYQSKKANAITWDDIENRPFGKGATVVKEIIPEDSILFTCPSNAKQFAVEMPVEYISPTFASDWADDWETCVCIWDGVEYVCEPQMVGGYKAIGDVDYITNGTPSENGAPFVFLVGENNGVEYAVCESIADMLAEPATEELTVTHNVSLSLSYATYNTLDSRYLGDVPWSKVTERPFNTTPAGTVVVEQSYVSDGYEAMLFNVRTDLIRQDALYHVKLNGIDMVGVGQFDPNDGITSIEIYDGDGAITGHISYFESYHLTFIELDSTKYPAGEYTVKVTTFGDDVKPLAKEFLPFDRSDVDLIGLGTEYTMTYRDNTKLWHLETEVVPTQAQLDLLKEIALAGESVSVVYDGVKYECPVIYDADPYGDGNADGDAYLATFGNLAIPFGDLAVDTGEPFFAAVAGRFSDNSIKWEVQTIVSETDDTSTSKVLLIRAYVTKITIPERMLPADIGSGSSGPSLPAVTTEDAGKFLRVTDEGVWAAVAMLDVSEVGL